MTFVSASPGIRLHFQPVGLTGRLPVAPLGTQFDRKKN